MTILSTCALTFLYIIFGTFAAFSAKMFSDNNKLYVWSWFIAWPILTPIAAIYVLWIAIKIVLFE